MTKIDIISGFLGAGKTTLIKKLLKEALSGEKIALLENEFGEIGIDGGFMKEAGLNITEMNSGCICCSLVGDFDKALKMLIDEYAPERIIIEPSGVGKLSDVAKAVENTGLTINSKTAVVDATKCKMYMKNFGEFFNNQIESASAIVLSRTANMSEEKIAQAVEMIRTLNEKAPIITTDWNELTGERIFEVMCGATKELIDEHEHHHDEECCCGHHHEHHHDEDCCHHDHEHHEHGEECGCHDHHHEHHHEHGEDCGCHDHHHEHHHEHGEECTCGCHGHHHHDHHADEVFSNFGFETAAKISKERLENALKALSDTEEYGFVLRAKGILCSDENKWIHFDFVPEEYEIRDGSADFTGRLCVIGTNLNEAKIRELFGL